MNIFLTILVNLWEQPGWLFGLLVVPFCLLVFLVAQKRRKQILARLGNVQLLSSLAAGLSPGLRWLKVVILAVALGWAIIAVARPQWGTITQTIRAKGADIVIVLDTSLSMLAEDVKPNRLASARHEIGRFLDGLATDRVALVPFAGMAYVQCPLTLDYSALKLFLGDITTSTIPVEGTAVGRAITTAMGAFVDDGRHRVIILITDGEDHDSEPLEAARDAHKKGVRIYTIGIGSPSGELIPQRTRSGGQEFLRDASGRVVKTRLDEVTLQKIAVETGGKYYRSTSGELELDEIFQDIGQLEKKEFKEQQLTNRVDRYQWPLGLAVLMLLIEPFIPDRRRNGNA
jgi:Ca-activated chloride channel homolog